MVCYVNTMENQQNFDGIISRTILNIIQNSYVFVSFLLMFCVSKVSCDGQVKKLRIEAWIKNSQHNTMNNQWIESTIPDAIASGSQDSSNESHSSSSVKSRSDMYEGKKGMDKSISELAVSVASIHQSLIDYLTNKPASEIYRQHFVDALKLQMNSLNSILSELKNRDNPAVVFAVPRNKLHRPIQQIASGSQDSSPNQSQLSPLTEGQKNVKKNISKLANAVVAIGWCLTHFKQNLPSSEYYRSNFECGLQFQISTLESFLNALCRRSVEEVTS